MIDEAQTERILNSARTISELTEHLQMAGDHIKALEREVATLKAAFRPFDQGPMIDLSLLPPETRIHVVVTPGQLNEACKLLRSKK